MPKAVDGTLDTFIINKALQPEPIASSQEIRDRGSIFIGNIYRATTPEDVKARVNHLKHFVHRQRKATHEIAAWRLMVLKAGKTGLEGPGDFELLQGSKDDGESWAGGKVLKVMQTMAVIDAVVIVSRWYGGTLLGPARFSHIETCAMEVCKAFKQTEELEDCLATLRMLDDMLFDLRKRLAAEREDDDDCAGLLREGRVANSCLAASTTSTPPESQTSTSTANGESTDVIAAAKLPDYNNLDIAKAKRLIRARENSIKSVKALMEKKKGQM